MQTYWNSNAPVRTAVKVCPLPYASVPFYSILLSCEKYSRLISSAQFSRSVVSDSFDPMNRSTPGLPVHHQLPESTQTHVH